jgi:hypothetical protein
MTSPQIAMIQKPTPEKISRSEKEIEAEYSAVTAMFKVAAKILAIRFFLFLSLAGSFALSIIATYNQSVQSGYILILYAIVTTLPLTVLEFIGKKNGG